MARSPPPLLLLLLLLPTCLLAQVMEECVEEAPGTKITRVENEYGCGILDCFNQTVNVTQYDDYTYAGWILPDLTVLNDTHNDGRITVEEYRIQIRNITNADVGFYHCMLQHDQTGEYFLIRLGLNAKGPFFINKWQYYKMNTIVGCSAFGGFLVLALLAYLVFHFRYIPDEDDIDDLKDAARRADAMVTSEYGVKPVLQSVPSYVPSIESFGEGGSPDSLRKRPMSVPGYEAGYQNMAYTPDEKLPNGNNQVGNFFKEPTDTTDSVITTEL